MSPIALKSMSYYPAPNAAGLPFTHQNNLVLQDAYPEPQDRIDYVLHRGLTVRDARTLVSGSPRPWPDVADNDWPSDHAAVLTSFALKWSMP